jgi:hypothetical protein
MSGIHHQIEIPCKKCFYLFECNLKDVDKLFITFIYGNYKEQLSTLEYRMIFQVESISPNSWNEDIFKSLRKDLLPYEVAHKAMFFPIYKEKNKNEIWSHIRTKIHKLNKEFLE